MLRSTSPPLSPPGDDCFGTLATVSHEVRRGRPPRHPPPAKLRFRTKVPRNAQKEPLILLLGATLCVTS
eukprot:scaffold64765_cov68-Phaeocystis_antarctica.AAC.1